MAVAHELLAPSVVTGIVSRIFTPGNTLQRLFNMQIGGSAVYQVSGRAWTYDIFDNVRTIAPGRAPATGPQNTAPNPVGRVTGTFPRSYEKVPLNYEMLHNLRQMGKDAGTRDRLGAVYIENQARFVKTRADNFREFELAALLTQGQMAMQFDGDNWIPVRSLGANAGFNISWQIPAGNLNINTSFAAGLNMTGAGNIITASWATVSTDIPGNLVSISQAFQELVGAPLAIVVTDSTQWLNILSNTRVKDLAGSVNTPYAEYTMEQLRGPDGNPIPLYEGRIKALPWLRFWIYDGGLTINGVYTKFWTNLATFLVEPTPMWIRMQEGSEPVKENPQAQAVERFGMFSWIREWDEPARLELHCLQNCIPELRVPKGVAISTIA